MYLHKRVFSLLLGSYFGLVPNNYTIDNVYCSGSEDALLDCRHKTYHNCRGNEAAGVFCNNGKNSIMLKIIISDTVL